MKCNNVLAACLMSVAEKNKIYGLDNYEEDYYNDAKVGK
jgi:hypothetical protein